MKNNYIVTLVKATTLLLAGVMVGCGDDTTPVEPQQTDGKVPIEVSLNKAYQWLPSRSADHPTYQVSDAKYLPDGSTVRLLILKEKPADNVVTIQASNVVSGEDGKLGHTYLVRNVGEYPYLYRCRVDADGTLIAGSDSEVPYYLDAPTESASDGKEGNYFIKNYYCMAISPARELQEENGIVKLAVNNGEELLVSNNHWTETQWQQFTITSNVEDKADVKLNPLMYATARIRIYIKNGDHVTDLIPGAPVVEIDRVPTNPGEKWHGDLSDDKEYTMDTYNLNIGDSIQSQMGNNILYNRMSIDTQEVDTTYTADGNREITIEATTYILPMDARPTPMIIRLNVGVNQTPMQFQYQSNRLFRAGHTYDYKAVLSLKEGQIYIASWQDMQWSAELDPKK